VKSVAPFSLSYSTVSLLLAIAWNGFAVRICAEPEQLSVHPRVALMNFVCKDNSYRSTMAAADFTLLVQASPALTDRLDFEWVERMELDRVEGEMQLAGIGLIDRLEAIQYGRWLKANWAVVEVISTNSSVGRMVSMDVVDLKNAEVLGVGQLTLPPATSTHFTVRTDEVTLVAASLRALLEQALVNHTARAQRRSVALLYFSRAGRGQGFPDLSEVFQNFYSRLHEAPDDPPEPLAMARGFFYRALEMNGVQFVIDDVQFRQRILERLWPHFLQFERLKPGVFDEAYREGLKRHFMELGRNGRDLEMLAELDDIARIHAAEAAVRPIPLPRTSVPRKNDNRPQVNP